MAADESVPFHSIQGSKTGAVERKFPRFPTALPCLYSKDDGPDWNGTTINLSLGGCAILGTTPVEKGDYLRVLIFPSSSQPPIEVGLAPVRWTIGEHFGVEFIMVTARDAQRLQSYLTFHDSA